MQKQPRTKRFIVLRFATLRSRWRFFAIALLSMLLWLSVTAFHTSFAQGDNFELKVQTGVLGKEGEKRFVGISSQGGKTVRVDRTKSLTKGDTLTVPRNGKYWAGMVGVDGKNYEGMILRTVPSALYSRQGNHFSYTFPCSASGEFTASWKDVVSGEACLGGLKLERPNSNLGGRTKQLIPGSIWPFNPAQGNRGDAISVVPTSDYTLIDVNTQANQVDVITGSVRIRSTENSQGQPVNAGESYQYGNIGKHNCQQTANNSPRVQALLDPDSWKSSGLDPAIRQGLTEHLQGQRAAVANCPVPPPELSNTERPYYQDNTPPSSPPPPDDIAITLQWATEDDLDLEIRDPRGQEISYKSEFLPTGVGRSYDDNQGCSRGSSHASENTNWRFSTAPNGQYAATINLYSDCSAQIGTVPFTLTLSLKGATQTFTDFVSEAKPTVTIPFSFPASGISQPVNVPSNSNPSAPGMLW